MAKLDLPTGPAELLEAVRVPLGHHLGGERELHLGGGTALAARWQHRHSTDVDLFVGASAFRVFREHEQQVRADLRSRSAGVQGFTVGFGHARIILAGGGEVSVSTSPPITPLPLSGDTVRGTDVPLETTAEILAKKLNYRMIRNGEIVPRDLYDIATAQRNAPAELEFALSTLRERHLRDISAELRHFGHQWMGQHPPPLISPASRHDAENAVRLVRDVIRRHIHSRSPARGPGLGR